MKHFKGLAGQVLIALILGIVVGVPALPIPAGVILMVFAAVNLLVTLYFQASVSAQRNAYASGVLVLMSCAGVVTVLDRAVRATAG